jgi:hypothetical protein
MEEHILGLLYGILHGLGQEDFARSVWKLRGSSKTTIMEALILMERKADTYATRWIATAKAALNGDNDRLRSLEDEGLRQAGFPTGPNKAEP